MWMARAINPLSGRFKTGYLPFFASGNGAWAVPRWVLGFCGLLLCATVCLGQSAPADDSGVDPKAESASVFDRVISNQKRLEADLNVFERVERVEIRKTASDPNPSEVKVWRVFPAGTGQDSAGRRWQAGEPAKLPRGAAETRDRIDLGRTGRDAAERSLQQAGEAAKRT